MLDHNFSDTKLIYRDDRCLLVEGSVEEHKYIILNCYAPCDSENSKRLFFKHIEKILDDHVRCRSQQNHAHILVLGDFNAVTSNDLDIISGHPHDLETVLRFNSFTSSNGLIDIWRSFNSDTKEYTWWRSHPFTARRLDYIFITDSVITQIFNAEISHVPFTDHRSVTVECRINQFPRGPSFYKFNNSLLEDARFIDEMNTFISSQCTVIDQHNYNPHEKLETLKVKIREKAIAESKIRSGLRQENTYKLEKCINELEAYIGSHPTDHLKIQELQNLQQKLEIETEYKRKGAMIRSKSQWIEKGEKCNSYFLGLEKSRQQANTIKMLKSGSKYSDTPGKISEQIFNFFKNLYSKKSNDDERLIYDFHNDVQIPQVDDSDNELLEAALTIDEIESALKKMKTGSSPGLDGLTTEFYKMFWPVLKNFIYDSYMYSIETGSLSPSQCKGVTTLIHKGKQLNKSDITNYRPISVGNTDYKILSRAIADRLKTVLPKIISDTQFGFMKGRNSSTLLRQIDDLLEYAENKNISGYILAIDYQKCFDSVSHEYTILSLKKFGFKPNFISLIKLLISNSECCVNNGGWLTDFYYLRQGLKQGCPLAPLTFLIVSEILSLKIKQNRHIQGIALSQDHTFHRILQFADDTTFFFKNLIDFREILSKIKQFSCFSGLTLNHSKSKIMRLSSSTPALSNTHNIESVRKIKILGVTFATGKTANSLEENSAEIVDKIDRLILSWSKRDLTIKGKILVVKTFMLSQCIYVMQSIGIQENILKVLNRKVFSFIWKRGQSGDKVKESINRQVICSPTEDGGLEMINLIEMHDSFMINWAISFCCNPLSPNMIIPNILFKTLDGKHIFETNCDPKTLNLKSAFWMRVMQTWFKHKNLKGSTTCISSYIWNNKDFTYKGKTLNFVSWYNKGIRYHRDISSNNRLLPLEEIIAKIGNSPQLIIEYHAVKFSYNRFYAKTIGLTLNKIGVTFKNKDIDELQKPKLIRTLIIKDSIEKPICVEFWRRQHGVTIDREIWELAQKATPEIRLQVLHWKLIHAIYPSNVKLMQMKIKDTELCPYCPNERDTISHFFFFCKKVQSLWKEVRSLVFTKHKIAINLTEVNVLTGFKKVDIPNLNRNEVNDINKLLLIAKMSVGMFKYGKGYDLLTKFQHELRIRNS